MLFAIRVDASLKIGTGHVYRMLTLANKLTEHGDEVFFICRNLKGNLISQIKNSFDLIELAKPSDSNQSNFNHCQHASWLEVDYQQEIKESQQAIEKYLLSKNKTKLDWLVIDHYAIEQGYHLALRHLTKKIFQIDDVADRAHQVDFLLDQNYFHFAEKRYQALLPKHSQFLYGPRYALLRDEFAQTKDKLTSYSTRMKNRKVVLFFGGIDLVNETEKALKALLSVDSKDHFDVIIGKNNPHLESIDSICQANKNRVSLHIQVNNMMDFFASAYLYVGAAGSTTWERCALALPAIVCSVANNQTQSAREMSEINAQFYLGLNSELSQDDYANAYKQLLSNPDLLDEQSKSCNKLVDAKGVNRVIEQLKRISIDE